MTDTPNPSIPAVADLLPPKWRSIIYLLSVVLAAVYAVISANTDMHYGWLAGYAGWNAAVGVLAVSNTPSMRTVVRDRGSISLMDVLVVLLIVAVIVWLLRVL